MILGVSSRTWLNRTNIGFYLQNMILNLNIYTYICICIYLNGVTCAMTFAPSQFNQDTAVASSNRSDERIKWQILLLFLSSSLVGMVNFHFLHTFLLMAFEIRKTCSSIRIDAIWFSTPQHPSFYLQKKNIEIKIRIPHSGAWYTTLHDASHFSIGFSFFVCRIKLSKIIGIIY